MDKKKSFPYNIRVNIKNSKQRHFAANQALKKEQSDLVRKLHQMAGIKGLSKNDLYAAAVNAGLERFLYKNSNRELKSFLDELTDRLTDK